jgi:hypothetical protein
MVVRCGSTVLQPSALTTGRGARAHPFTMTVVRCASVKSLVPGTHEARRLGHPPGLPLTRTAYTPGTTSQAVCP